MSVGLFPLFLTSLFLLLTGAVAYLFWRLRRLENERDGLTSMYLDQQQRQISALQRDLSRLQTRLDQQTQTGDGDLSPYNQAIEMIRQGLTALEVASRCGISRSEAELIVSLYRNNSSTS
ncbi:DUF2802 domain-containing protein [Neisseriaceae bacterium TC5R-5]|nr:DUF2802 domain-containing protein [Neisseriaceae bacterium TC5R-5]